MGVSISLLFVRGHSVESTLSKLQLATTGERLADPSFRKGVFVMAELPSGFHMILSNRLGDERFSKMALARLSANGECVLQHLEEHVMFSQTDYWENGVQVWSVIHSGDVDPTDLKSEGKPPAAFHDFKAEQDAADPNDQDYFDIAVRLADNVTGFRYDRSDYWQHGTPYSVLVSTAPAKKPFWKLW